MICALRWWRCASARGTADRRWRQRHHTAWAPCGVAEVHNDIVVLPGEQHDDFAIRAKDVVAVVAYVVVVTMTNTMRFVRATFTKKSLKLTKSFPISRKLVTSNFLYKINFANENRGICAVQFPRGTRDRSPCLWVPFFVRYVKQVHFDIARSTAKQVIEIGLSAERSGKAQDLLKLDPVVDLRKLFLTCGFNFPQFQFP